MTATAPLIDTLRASVGYPEIAAELALIRKYRERIETDLNHIRDAEGRITILLAAMQKGNAHVPQ